MGHVLQALLLTFMGAAGTALGGLMVVVQPRMQFQRLGALQVWRPCRGGQYWHPLAGERRPAAEFDTLDRQPFLAHFLLQGLAAGLMLSISIFDLLPESIEEIGFVHANVCFYVGVLLFAAVVYFIPEPDVSIIMDPVAAAKKDSPIPSGSSNLSSAHAQDGR
jgi:ZIP family zinc transporter